MTDNYSQPLNTRPKRTDNTAVEAWLAENAPTVYPPFEKIAPRAVGTAKRDDELSKCEKQMIAKAERITKKINTCGSVSRTQFNKQYGNCKDELKRVMKQYFNVSLVEKKHVNEVGKVSYIVGVK